MSIFKNLFSFTKKKIVPTENQSSIQEIIDAYISSLSQSTVSYNTIVASYTSWIFTTVNKIALSEASLKMGVYAYQNKVTGKYIDGRQIKSYIKNQRLPLHEERKYLKALGIEKVEVQSHPFLDLMHRPNQSDTRATFIMRQAIHMELDGQAPVYFVKNGLGQPIELYVLPFTNNGVFKVIGGAQKLIDHYEYAEGGKKTIFNLDEIMWMHYPSLVSPFEGTSPLKAQSYPYDIDNFLQQQQYNLMKNGAVFGNVFSVDNDRLTADQIAKIKSDLKSEYASAKRTGKSLFLHSGLKLSESITPPTKDLMLDVITRWTRDKLLSAYDMPAGKLGLTESVNRATEQALNDVFFRECIAPRLMVIEEFYERDILPLYDDRLTLDFVIPQYDERELDLRERDQNLRGLVTTINEERGKMNLEPVDWGDRPFVPFNLSPYGEAPAPVVNASLTKAKVLTDDFKSLEWKRFDNYTRAYERLFKKIMNKHWDSELKSVLASLEAESKKVLGNIAGFSKQKIRTWVSEHKDKIAKINIDKEKQKKILKEKVDSIYVDIFETTGEHRAGALNMDVQFKVQREEVQKWLGERLDKFSDSVEGTTFDEIDAILREGFKEGIPVNEMAKQLSEKFASFEQYRAPLIARTEAAAASNFADLEYVKQVGLEDSVKKIWLTAQDEKVRDSHVQAGKDYVDGIAIDENFNVGGDEMDAPGNGSDAGENINCRCALGYVEI